MVHTVTHTYVVLVLLALVICIFKKDHCREQTQKVELPTFPVENPPVYGMFFPLLDLFAGVFYGPSQNFKRTTIWLKGPTNQGFSSFHGTVIVIPGTDAHLGVSFFQSAKPKRTWKDSSCLWATKHFATWESRLIWDRHGIAMANNNCVAETCTPSKSCMFLWAAEFQTYSRLPTSWKNQGKSSCKYNTDSLDINMLYSTSF